jgi:cytochrome c5
MARNGKQYVVVAAGGTNRFRMIANTADKNSDALIAYALGDKQESQKTPPPANAPAASRAVMASTSGTLPEGEGKATVVAVCTKCHGPANFTMLRMSRQGWTTQVEDMKDKGAVGTDEDFQRVIDYLARNFPAR